MSELQYRPVLPAPETQADRLALIVEPLPPCGMISLRAELGEEIIHEAVRHAFGLEIPGIRQCILADDRGVFWMSPDELLLRTAVRDVGETVSHLSQAMADTHHLVVDMSDARSRFRLLGDGAREVIAKGAPVDMHPEAFRPGMFRRTRIGQVAAAFHQVSESPEGFEIMCFRSFARYMRDWLHAAAREESLPGVF